MIVNCVKCNKNLPVPDVVFKHGIPRLICPFCHETFRPDIESLKEQKTVLLTNKTDKGKRKAWIIVNLKNTPVQTFDLGIGKQLIGRINESKKCDIMIDTPDSTMSRNHFFIEVLEQPNENKYILSDAGSSNKTYIKSKNLILVKQGDEFILDDGDIILAGKTEILFRKEHNDIINNFQSTVLVQNKPKKEIL